SGHPQAYRLTSGCHGVERAAIAEAQRAVCADAQVPHWVLFHEGDLDRLAARGASPEHVHAALLLAEVVHLGAVRAEHGAKVFPREIADLRVGPGPAVPGPDVARDGGGVMLAELVLIPFLILEHDQLP